jgi:hypothetical protein
MNSVEEMRDLRFCAGWLCSQLERCEIVMQEALEAIHPESAEHYQLAIRRKLEREIEGVERSFKIIRLADAL